MTIVDVRVEEEEWDCGRLWMDWCMRNIEEGWWLLDGKVVVAAWMVPVGGVDCL